MPIQEGDFIRLNYTGYSNGVLFDTTVEQKAREAGVFEEDGDYTPKVICVGKRQIIIGLGDNNRKRRFEETLIFGKAFGEQTGVFVVWKKAKKAGNWNAGYIRMKNRFCR